MFKRNLWLFTVSLIVALFLGEIVLRLIGFSYQSFHQSDFYLGTSLRPGAKGWYREEGEAWVQINSKGMRDDREVVIEKPSNVFRIAVLGDSYAEAIQVPVEKTFWRKLETLLNQCGYAKNKKVEVLNFGVSGYSTAQELLTLRHRVQPYNPDLVLLAFLSGNDVRDNSKAIAGLYPRPYFQLANGNLIQDTSFRMNWIFKLKTSTLWRIGTLSSDYLRIVQLFNKARNIIGQPFSAPQTEVNIVDEIGLDDHIYLSAPPQIWEDAWALTEALIVETKREAEKQGASFLLVTLTNPIQVMPDRELSDRIAQKLGEADLFYPERRLESLARREKIEAIFLAEPFAQYAAKHKVYLHGFPNTQMGSGHWNERGHELAAWLIAQYLCGTMARPIDE